MGKVESNHLKRQGKKNDDFRQLYVLCTSRARWCAVEYLFEAAEETKLIHWVKSFPWHLAGTWGPNASGRDFLTGE